MLRIKLNGKPKSMKLLVHIITLHLSKFQLSIHRRHLGGTEQEPLSYSIRFTFMGTLAPSSPATFGLGKIDGCLSIFVLGPLGNSKV
jgi:hypothetical protein